MVQSLTSAKSKFLSLDLEQFLKVGHYATRILSEAKRLCPISKSPTDLVDRIYRTINDTLRLEYRWVSIGTGVNQQFVHNAWHSPDPFTDGDIIKVEIGLDITGYYVEVAETWSIGAVGESDRVLIETTRKALESAIEVATCGTPIRAVGRAIYNCINDQGLSVARYGAGHAIKVDETSLDNRVFPWVLNWDSEIYRVKPSTLTVSSSELERSQDTLLSTGMCIAIEPMANAGGPFVMEDQVTLNIQEYKKAIHLPFWKTKDGSNTAKFVHTIFIEKDQTFLLTNGQA